MIAELIARIRGDSSGFEEAGNRAIRKISDIRGQVSSMAPMLAGAFSVAGLTALAKSAIESASQIHDMALRLGVSTDTLQKFSYAAKQSGSDVSVLVKGILSLQTNITTGGIESEKYAKALKILGLTAKELAEATPEEALMRLADAFTSTENRAEANGAMLALIGGKMQSLIPLLAEGRDGIQKLFAEAPTMGAETVAQLEALGDELDRLKGEVLPGVAEALNFVIVKFREARGGWEMVGAAHGGAWGELKNVLNGKSVADAWRDFKKDFIRDVDEIYRKTSERPKPVRAGKFEAPGESTEEKTKGEKFADNRKALESLLRRLDEINFRNKLKSLDQQQRLNELKAKELELSNQITAAESDSGMSDEDFLKLEIERAQLQGEIADLQAQLTKPEKADKLKGESVTSIASDEFRRRGGAGVSIILPGAASDQMPNLTREVIRVLNRIDSHAAKPQLRPVSRYE